MDRMTVLMDLAKKRIAWYNEDRAKYEKWRDDNPEKYSWDYSGEFRVTPAEIKRLLLVLRQESIRFEKSLK